MKILIVDDNATNLYLLESMLKAHGHEVVQASNGLEALRLPGLGSVDLIISDILMPEMDGYNLCRHIKSRPDTMDIPFVFYTATYTEEADRTFALKLGASRFVLKPEEPRIFISIIDEVIKEREEGRIKAVQAELTDDLAFLKSYNERLVKKIDDKLFQLQNVKNRLRAEVREKGLEALERTQVEASLHLVEDRYKNVFENALEGMFRTTSHGQFLSANPALAAMLGFESPAALIGSETHGRFLAFVSPEEYDDIKKAVDARGFVQSRETLLTVRDGRRVWILLNLRTVRDPSGEVLFYEGSAIDITTLKDAEEALREREAFVEAVLENIPDMIFVKDAATLRFVRVNKAAENLMGIPRSELYGKTDADFFPRTEAEFYAAKDRDALNMRMFVDIPEETMQTKTRGKRILHTKKIPVPDSRGNPQFLLGISEDITEKKKSDEKVLASLREKEVLLRELYHRTKNNMQVIISILSLQERNLKDPRLTRILKDIQTRIRAMSLVHQKLYQSKDLSSIELRSYVEELIAVILDSHAVGKGKIDVDVKIPRLSIMIDTAIPCGLILHELATNVINHAFPGHRKGTIAIGARRVGEDIEIQFADDGVGFPEGFNPRATGHVGLGTITAIVEHQLQGRIEFKSRGGLKCLIRFSDPASARRI